jgi:DnaJ-class molecular chaperone
MAEECKSCIRGYVYDSYRGVTTNETCPDCGGSGFVPECKTCNGALTIKVIDKSVPKNGYRWKTICCPDCNAD